jgi:glycosyltransferase involved in cell wall biosynthesis
MKIVHVITGLGNGGAEGALYRLVKYDQANDHIVISLLDHGKYGQMLEQANIRVLSLGMPRGSITLSAILKLRKHIKQEAPDVVHTWMYHSDFLGGLIARSCGIKNIMWCIRNSTLDREKTSLVTRAVAKACALLSNIVPKTIVSCSRDASKIHIELGYSADKIVTIPNGYDFSALKFTPQRRQQLREEMGVADSIVLIGMVARWDPQKDHHNLLQALSLLPASLKDSWRLVLIGNQMQADNAELTALIEEAGLESQVLLYGPTNDVVGLMSALDLHVLSSAYGEAFPNVVAEAMACETPSISTNVGDAAYIVNDDSFVVPPSDPVALKLVLQRCISQAVNEPLVWLQFGEICRARVIQEFSIEQMVQAFNREWLRLAGNGER